jgi:hypothetical protein
VQPVGYSTLRQFEDAMKTTVSDDKPDTFIASCGQYDNINDEILGLMKVRVKNGERVAFLISLVYKPKCVQSAGKAKRPPQRSAGLRNGALGVHVMAMR